MEKHQDPKPIKNLEDNSWNITLYHFTILAFSAASGHYLKQTVRVHKHKLLRFQNVRHYILKGDFFDFPGIGYQLARNRVEDIELVFIDALVRTSEGSVIYDSILVDYELSSDGGLNFICLKEAEKRYLKDSFGLSAEDSAADRIKRHGIPEHLFMIKYSEIANLNFSYYKPATHEDDSITAVRVA